MEHAITLGDILKFAAIGGGIFVVLAIAYYFLSAFGRGMSQ